MTVIFENRLSDGDDEDLSLWRTEPTEARLAEVMNHWIELSPYILYTWIFFLTWNTSDLIWWTGNSCCFIGFCERFCVVLPGVLAPRVASIFRVRWLTRLRDSACRWSSQNAEQRCLPVKKSIIREEKKKKKTEMKICFRCTQLLIHAFTCVYMLASGCFPVCLATHITQCIQLPLLMEDVPREKSPQFRVQVQISLWWCYLFGEASWWGDRGGAAVQESKNLGTRLIREDVLKGDRWWRGEMQKGLAASGGLRKWRNRKQMCVLWEGLEGGKGD